MKKAAGFLLSAFLLLAVALHPGARDEEAWESGLNKIEDMAGIITNNYYKPDINSDESESYISWSSNSKWFVLSSRRLDGVTSKPFICHIDSLGNTSKPFILPQENPLFYTINHKNFSRPELIKNKVNLNFGNLKNVIYSKAFKAIDDSTTFSDSSSLKNVR